MSYSAYQILTIVSLTASAIYSILSILRNGINPRSKKKSDFVDSLKMMSGKMREFYEKFNPPMRVDNSKDTWFHIYFTILLAFLFIMNFATHRFSFSILVVGLATIAEFTGLTSLYEIYEMPKVTKVLEEFNDKNSKKTVDELVGDAYKQNWFFIRFFVGKIFAILFINVFIVSNVSLTQNPNNELIFYLLSFVTTFYIVVFEAYLYRRLYTELEFAASQKYLSTSNKKVDAELHVDASRNKTLSLMGKLIAIGKYLYILREDGFIQEVSFRTIQSISIRETQIDSE